MTMRTFFTCLMAAAFGLSSPVCAQNVLIKDANVYTMDGPNGAARLAGGDVWIRGDSIAGVGRTISGNAATQVIDGAGLWVTPGIIDAYSSLGTVEINAEASSNDTAAPGAAFSAGLDMAYAINPASTLIAISRLEGLTRAASVSRGSRDIFGGYGAVISLSPYGEAVLKDKAFMRVTLGERGAAAAGGSRAAAGVYLREALSEARGQYTTGDFENLLGRIDKNALRPVARGDKPLFVEVHRASDILNVLALKAENRRLDLTLVGAKEGWLVADKIAAANVPVIVDAALNLPDRFERIASSYANAAQLSAAGVKLAIASGPDGDMAQNARLLLQRAGIAVSYGLPWEKALAAVTIDAADILGVSTRLGSLAPGKLADVVVWSGDPFELTSRPVMVFIAGRRIALVSRQTLLRERYRDLSEGTPFSYRK